MIELFNCHSYTVLTLKFSVHSPVSKISFRVIINTFLLYKKEHMKPFSLLLFLCISFASHAQKMDDTTAIKQLLDKESSTWRSGDVKAHADCWHVQPYSKMLVSTADGKALDIPASVMINPPAGMMGKGGTSERSNYTFSIHGDDAWVSHDEVSTSADGIKSYSHEIRMLEKINGEWKLVAQSIHAYKP